METMKTMEKRETEKNIIIITVNGKVTKPVVTEIRDGIASILMMKTGTLGGITVKSTMTVKEMIDGFVQMTLENTQTMNSL